MTIRKFIKELEKYPQHFQVYFNHKGVFYPVGEVDKKDGKIWRINKDRDFIEIF